MTRLYLAGPMSGLPDLNFPLFAAVTANLRAAGHDVVSPAEVCADIKGEWADCMCRDLPAMLTCEGIAMLPGWEHSRGARLERHVAAELGMPIWKVSELLTTGVVRLNGCHNRAPYVTVVTTHGSCARRRDMS